VPEIILFRFPGYGRYGSLSPFCEKVAHSLRRKGLGFRGEELYTPRRVNPRGTLPALRYDGHLLVDSTEIVRFLDEKQPDPPLVPRDPRARAEAHVFEEWADESLYYHVLRERWLDDESFARLRAQALRGMAAVSAKVVRRSIRRKLEAHGLGRLTAVDARIELRRALDALSDLVTERPFLVGAESSNADVAAFAMIDALRSDLTPEARDEILARRPLVDWVLRCSDQFGL
jgi:glutathione S-transferase